MCLGRRSTHVCRTVEKHSRRSETVLRLRLRLRRLRRCSPGRLGWADVSALETQNVGVKDVFTSLPSEPSREPGGTASGDWATGQRRRQEAKAASSCICIPRWTGRGPGRGARETQERRDAQRTAHSEHACMACNTCNAWPNRPRLSRVEPVRGECQCARSRSPAPQSQSRLIPYSCRFSLAAECWASTYSYTGEARRGEGRSRGRGE